MMSSPPRLLAALASMTVTSVVLQATLLILGAAA